MYAESMLACSLALKEVKKSGVEILVFVVSVRSRLREKKLEAVREMSAL